MAVSGRFEAVPVYIVIVVDLKNLDQNNLMTMSNVGSPFN